MDFIACDLETTGLDPVNDKIIEIAMVKVVNGKIIDTFNTLVNPQCKIPLKIKRLTGIEDNHLTASPTLEEVAPNVHTFMEQCPLVGHNIDFDRSFLVAHLGHLPFTHNFDTLEMARLLLPGLPGYSLANLVQFLQLQQKPLHRALDDALAATDLFFYLLKKAETLKLDILLQLLPLLQYAHSPLAYIFESIIKNKIKTIPAEKIAKDIPIKEPALFEQDTPYATPDINNQDNYQLEHLLGPQSPLGQLLPNYQYREEQVRMARSVAQSLEEQKILLVEAGTGTGKSIAYLLPTLLWATRNDQRAVIATNTITLQEQIWHKDIPLLKNMLGLPFQAALLKGRSNYICLRRFINLINHPANITTSEAMLVARIFSWLQYTDTGDKSELNLFGQDNETWRQLCSESDTCMGSACRWFNRYCFVTRARRNAENAHLIIINHSLLFADVVSEINILPQHGAVIMDEAHNIEETAAKHMGKNISRSDLLQWLAITGKSIKKLNELAPPQDGQRWLEAVKKAEEARYKLQDNINIFFNLFIKTIHKYIQNKSYYQIKVRLHQEDKILAYIKTELQNMLYQMHHFLSCLKSLATWLEIWTVTNNAWEDKLQDVNSSITAGNGYMAVLDFILTSPEENYVCWVEAPNSGAQLDKGNYHCILHATPIDISAVLHEHFFNKTKTFVLTSATLTVNNKFDHFIKQCGLDRMPNGALKQIIVQSPFNYDRQCLLCIANNIPESSDGDYVPILADTIYELATATEGRTLVLFTSHKMLRETYFKIKSPLDEVDICVLGQGLDGSRSKLVTEFLQNKRSVLFGSLSFWEGIDIPGDALVNVIIVKLPFAPPDDPVLEARNEKMIAQGYNSFYGISLPNAVIRFKQGFGRLIRSEQDRGTVIILDKRIIKKRYGHIFLNSLPVKSYISGGIDEIKYKLTNWFGLNC